MSRRLNLLKHFAPFAIAALYSLALFADTRLELEDGSSLIFTSSFRSIDIQENRPERTVIVGHSVMQVLFVVVIDSTLNKHELDPVAELRLVLNDENLNLKPIASDRAIVVPDEDDPQAQLTRLLWVTREIANQHVHFFLMGVEGDFEAAEPDFRATVNSFVSREKTLEIDDKPSPFVVAAALTFLCANLLFLWRSFRRYARLASSADEVI